MAAAATATAKAKLGEVFKLVQKAAKPSNVRQTERLQDREKGVNRYEWKDPSFNPLAAKKDFQVKIDKDVVDVDDDDGILHRRWLWKTLPLPPATFCFILTLHFD